MTKTEIWLRFISEEDFYSKKEAVFNLLNNDNEGDKIFIYIDDTGKTFEATNKMRYSPDAYLKLEELLGKNNVKVRTTTKKLSRNFYCADNEKVSLERIANALENIGGYLEIICNRECQ